MEKRITVRLPNDIFEQLSKVAAADAQTLSYLCRKGLEETLFKRVTSAGMSR